MENKMIEKINQEIENAKEIANTWKNEAIVEKAIIKIKGMIELLEFVTNKNYYFDNEGVHEK